jgi:chemotaxis protein methyltransferase CheR
MDLIKDKFEKGFDIILCRNVVIYFEPETKTALYLKFLEWLRPGGYLMTGATEQIFDYKKLGFESAGPFMYRRPK